MLKKIFMHNKVRSITLLILAVLLTVALGSYSQNDPSFNLSTVNEPANLLSYFGSYLSDVLYQLIGVASFFVPITFVVWAYLIYKNGFLSYKALKIISLVVAIACICIVLSNIKINTLPADGGGVLGIYLLNIAIKHLEEFEQLILPITFLLSIFFLVLTLGIQFTAYIKFTSYIRNFFVKMVSYIKIPKFDVNNFNSNVNQSSGGARAEVKIARAPIIAESNNDFDMRSASPTVENKIQVIKKESVARNISGAEQEAAILPSVDLLDEANDQHIKLQSSSELEEKARELLVVLGDFGVKGKVVEIRQGPVVTMYEFEPAAGTKSSRVIGLSDDIARSLSAHSTRIAVIPGRNALGIELPNEQRMFFRLKELVETEEFQDQNTLLPIILGKDLGGRPLIADLAKMPHLLVAGTTGSGKSVAINAMIMSLLYRYTPAECRMIMIDPKMLELSSYDNIPHLMTPVVTEPGKAVVALKWAVKEMENRYRLMSHLGVRSIANFNTKILEAIKDGKVLERRVQTGFDPETGKPVFESVPIDMQKMPFIVVIVDEMADLMLVAGKDIETSIQRLAQMARAAGIHIIMATQRPSVDVITGVIKANFPSRISFKVTSKIDSRTILGEQGSEQLLGMGDMLYMGNSARILRVHGPFVDDKEVERVTSFLRTTGVPEYVSAVTESDEDFSADELDESDNNDNIYKQALNIVRNERKTSISYIQRSLRIGYNRAANIIEEMEKNGILSAPNHSGKREVLLPED
jgi:DNA segregation ATPase FtsK/SpoIIIE, S-DNA-T family